MSLSKKIFFGLSITLYCLVGLLIIIIRLLSLAGVWGANEGVGGFQRIWMNQLDQLFLLITYILIGIALIAILVWLLRRDILSRIIQMEKQVSQLTTSEDAVGAIDVVGRDRLSSLGHMINQTVAELRKSQQDLAESEEKYRRLVEQSTVISYTDAVNDSSSALYFSPQVEKLLGYTADEWIKDSELWVKSIHPEDADRVLMEHLRTNQTGDPFCLEYRMMARDGHVVWVHDEAVLHRDEQGKPVHWIGVMRDITEQKCAEEAEKRERALVHALYETGKNLNSSLDFDTVLDRLLEAISRVVPYESASVMLVEHGIARVVRTRGYGKNGSSIEASLEHKFEIKKSYVLAQMAQSRRAMVVSDTRDDPEWATASYSEHVLSWVGAPLVNRGRVLGFLSLKRTQASFYTPEHAQNLEIFATQAAIAVDNARLFQQIQEAATRDQLTGVYNRRHFFDQATAAFERARRFHRPLALLIWDIDHFKIVNDTYGHITGDQVLQLVAERSRQNLREVDILGRYGGEEFVAILGEADTQMAREVAERLRASIEKTSYQVEEHTIELSISVGVAEIGDCARLEEMLARADRALYKAKRNGRNRVWIWGKTGQLVSKTLVAA